MTTSQPLGSDDLERTVHTNVRDFDWHTVNVIEEDGHYSPMGRTIHAVQEANGTGRPA